jgi:hypothetical protein
MGDVAGVPEQSGLDARIVVVASSYQLTKDHYLAPCVQQLHRNPLAARTASSYR